MTRLWMPGAMPAEIAERLSDVPGNDIESFILLAREELADMLRDGKRVGRCNLWDLIENELNTDRERIFIDEIGSLLLCGRDGRNLTADRIADGLIERYLIAHPELAEDRAAWLAADAEDDRE